MVEISYKAPFLEMLNKWRTWTHTERMDILREIAEDVSIDAENCDTPSQALKAIADRARTASFSRNYIYYMNQIIAMFRSLDDDIPCEVEESSPLAKYRYGKLS